MAFPSDIVLPVDAKYFVFIERKKWFNSNYDICWSFQFAITANDMDQQALLTTFLCDSYNLTAYPGQYGGYNPYSPYLLTENKEYLLTDNIQRFILEPESSPEYVFNELGDYILTETGDISAEVATYANGSSLVGIGFDTTGLFALSSDLRSGVSLNDIKTNSLIVRNELGDVIFNESLSNIDSEFILLSTSKAYQTLRFCVTNNGTKLSIDYRPENSVTYIPLTSFTIDIGSYNSPFVYMGISFSSPVSSSTGIPATLFLRNFQFEGSKSLETDYSTLTTTKLNSNIYTSYVPTISCLNIQLIN
jgi:hypothetical protein